MKARAPLLLYINFNGLFLISLCSVVIAQTSGNSSISDSNLDPSTISISIRTGWCTQNENTCSLVCGGTTSTNNCDANTLLYSCVCADGLSPDLKLYKNTIPAIVCEADLTYCYNSTNESVYNCTNWVNCSYQNPGILPTSEASTSVVYKTTLSFSSTALVRSSTSHLATTTLISTVPSSPTNSVTSRPIPYSVSSANVKAGAIVGGILGFALLTGIIISCVYRYKILFTRRLNSQWPDAPVLPPMSTAIQDHGDYLGGTSDEHMQEVGGIQLGS